MNAEEGRGYGGNLRKGEVVPATIDPADSGPGAAAQVLRRAVAGRTGGVHRQPRRAPADLGARRGDGKLQMSKT